MGYDIENGLPLNESGGENIIKITQKQLPEIYFYLFNDEKQFG